MLEFVGLLLIAGSVVEVFTRSGEPSVHFFMGISLVMSSMLIKSHAELVQIKNYIGDSKKQHTCNCNCKKEVNDVDVVEVKENEYGR